MTHPSPVVPAVTCLDAAAMLHALLMRDRVISEIGDCLNTRKHTCIPYCVISCVRPMLQQRNDKTATSALLRTSVALQLHESYHFEAGYSMVYGILYNLPMQQAGRRRICLQPRPYYRACYKRRLRLKRGKGLICFALCSMNRIAIVFVTTHGP